MMLEVYVPGRPVPQGSVTPFVAGNGRARVRYRAAVTDYRARLFTALVEHRTGERVEGPVLVDLLVDLVRPKAHYRTGRHAAELKPDAPAYPTTRGTGDVDKYARLALDAITDSGIWRDDSQTVTLIISKQWAEQAGLTLHIETMIGVAR